MDLLDNVKQHELSEVIEALNKIRIKANSVEYTIQDQIAIALSDAEIEFEKEVKLSPRNRIDFLISGGIGIEVKRGKPNTYSVINQLERYAGHKNVTELLLVSERSINIPSRLNGKPCMTFNLNRLWGGIAI